MLTNIPKSGYLANPSGQSFWTVGPHSADLWVDGGPGTEGKMQDSTGAWVDVDPVGTLVDFHSVNSGGSSYQVSMVRSPSDAKIYYTVDGSEPTASSFLYTGPLTYTGGSIKITIKAKAIGNGIPTGETVSKFVMANSSGLQATSTVPHFATGAAVRSSYVVYDLLGNRIAEGIDLPGKERLACGTYLVRITANGQSVTSKLPVLSARKRTKFLR